MARFGSVKLNAANVLAHEYSHSHSFGRHVECQFKLHPKGQSVWDRCLLHDVHSLYVPSPAPACRLPPAASCCPVTDFCPSTTFYGCGLLPQRRLRLDRTTRRRPPLAPTSVLPVICRNALPSLCPPVCLPVCLSICLSVCLTVCCHRRCCLSRCLPVELSACPLVCPVPLRTVLSSSPLFFSRVLSCPTLSLHYVWPLNLWENNLLGIYENCDAIITIIRLSSDRCQT